MNQTDVAFELAGRPGKFTVLHYRRDSGWETRGFTLYDTALAFFLGANLACLFDNHGRKLAETVRAEQ